ncbi:hypothetical protein ILYODFUR_024861 [Ilyodon furcidens]|uniref:Uncharacterized protein n=1 Tax=Ilyodon furcidens TaxID=33524 RepID=A0ABV0UM04_9TELE
MKTRGNLIPIVSSWLRDSSRRQFVLHNVVQCLVAESGVSFLDVMKKAPEPQLVCTPNPAAQQVYDQMLKRFPQLEERVLQKTYT